MAQRIIYQLPGRPVSIITPCECGLSIDQIARKDTPAGAPFWIVDASSFPTDRSHRDAWELDVEVLGQPSGYGTAEEV